MLMLRELRQLFGFKFKDEVIPILFISDVKGGEEEGKKKGTRG